MVVATGRSAAARRTRWSVLMGVCAIAAWIDSGGVFVLFRM